VAVEKGTKAVISVNFRAEGRRTFNNLRTNFAVGIPQKEFFNSYGLFTTTIAPPAFLVIQRKAAQTSGG
jgi:hypothetical protein